MQSLPDSLIWKPANLRLEEDKKQREFLYVTEGNVVWYNTSENSLTIPRQVEDKRTPWLEQPYNSSSDTFEN